VATGFAWIGKEANQVRESGDSHPLISATEQFNSPGIARRRKVLGTLAGVDKLDGT
jgi:hypothetical protein